MQICDFHTHTLYSDGELLPVEQARRAKVNGCAALALTDHVGMGNYATVLEAVRADCALIRQYWDIIAIPGVEVTHS
ncbi:MAG: PHP domain-containing protein, partial [Chloroflexi bacterium]|nr:PHP domain-containing protein [Chloroflexota bacterium]